VEVGEEDQSLAQVRKLGGDGLLDLEQEVALGPDLVHGDDPRAHARVRVVRERAALAGSALDRDLVAALRQLERARRRERDAVLARLDLPGDAEAQSGAPIPAPRDAQGPAPRPAAYPRHGPARLPRSRR